MTLLRKSLKLALVALLVAIFAAAIIQFTLKT